MGDQITKSLFRKSVLQYRKMLGANEYEARNGQLCERVKHFAEERSVRCVHLFLPIQKNNEPSLISLLDTFWKKNIKTLTSRTDFKNETLHHFLFTKETELTVNERGIPEPAFAEEASLVDPDIIFVPLLACDRLGNRIGYGGGYYDRLLAETKALKVGLSLSPLVDKIVQSEDWDVPLDYLITPFKIYEYG